MTEVTEEVSRTVSWVQSNTRRVLTEFQGRAVELLADGFNCGIYNVNVNWEKVDWKCGSGVRFTVFAGNGLATYDYDHMTRFVVLAHDRCIRVDIAPAANRFLYIYMHPRDREGDMSRRHPTIEDAIKRVRGANEHRTRSSDEGEPK